MVGIEAGNALHVGDQVELVEQLPGRRGLRVGAIGTVVRDVGYWDRVEVKFVDLPGPIVVARRVLRVYTPSGSPAR
jgi:hypothetical protein